MANMYQFEFNIILIFFPLRAMTHILFYKLSYYLLHRINFYASLPGAPNLEEQNNISLQKICAYF